MPTTRSAKAVSQAFIDDDDDDSVATDSTTDSEPREEYNVEAIRAEREHPEKGLEYLVDWEGYPLHRATWEVVDNILSDVVIRDWVRTQQAIKEGRQEPFDEEEWKEAVEENEAKKDERHRRRRVKRKSRGLPISPHSSDTDVIELKATRKRVRKLPVQRKGVAQPVTKKRRVETPTPKASEKKRELTKGEVIVVSTNSLFVQPVHEQPRPLQPAKEASPGKVQKGTGQQDTSQQDTNQQGTNQQNATEQNATQQDVTQQDATQQDATQQDATQQDATQQNATQQDVTQQDATQQDATQQDATQQDATQQDATQQDTTQQDTTQQDAIQQDATQQDATQQDATQQDGTQQGATQQGTNQQGTNQQGTNQQGTNQQGTNQQGTVELQNAKGPVEAPSKAQAATVPTKVPPEAPLKASPQTRSQTRTTFATRKSAPNPPDSTTAGTPKVPAKDIMANWAAEKARRERPWVSGETPKDSFEPRFKNLSQQNRHQLYSRNEPAPDPNALTVVDPKTGKAMPQKAATQNLSSGRKSPPLQNVTIAAEKRPLSQKQGIKSTDITHSAYQRRTPPPEPTQTTSSVSVLGSSERERTAQNREVSQAEAYPHPPKAHTLRPRSELTETCWYWQQGTCRYTAETCVRAHWIIPAEAPDAAGAPHASSVPDSAIPEFTSSKQKTCYYWYTNGVCRKDEQSCLYAHRWTGTLAEPPRNYVGPSPSLTKEQGTAADEQQQANALSRHVPVAQARAPSQDNALATGPPAAPTPLHSQPVLSMRKKEKTCHFWRTSICDKAEEQCEFAHRDTGIYAKPPGTWRRGVRDGTSNTNRNVQETATDSRGPSVQNDTIAGDTRQLPIDPVQSRVQVTHPQAQEMEPSTNRDSGSREAALQRRQIGTPNSPIDATLILSFGKDQSPMQLSVKLRAHNVFRVTKLAGPNPTLHVSRTVMAKDFQQVLWHEHLRAQDYAIGGMDVTPSNDLIVQNLLDLSKLHATGLVATVGERGAKMLLYPSRAEEWKFIETEEIASRCLLRFCLFEKLPDAAAVRTEGQPFRDTSALSSTVLVGEGVVGLDREQLIPKNEITLEQEQLPKDSWSTGERPVFLMFPPTHCAELEVYTNYFQGFGGKVYSSQTRGAWSYFCKKYPKAGLVVIHPETPLWRIPGLYGLFRFKGCKMRVFSIGIDQTRAKNEQREPHFSCERLFPHGSVTLITDEVFAHYPEKAIEVIESFWYANRHKPEGARFERIAARPGLKQWLCRLALSKTHECERRDNNKNRWMKLYETVLRLCPPDAEDVETREPLPNSNLVSLSPDLLPGLNDLWERNEAAAVDMVVEWFAGWSVNNANRYRKFTICNTSEKITVDVNGKGLLVEEPDPLGWGDKYTHLGVLLPHDVVSLFSSKKEKQKKK